MGFTRAAIGLLPLPGAHGQNRAARGAPREIGRVVSLRFPLFSECGSVDKNDFLRFPPFCSVFLCSFYTVCATFSWPTLNVLVGLTICPEPALWAKDQGVLDPALCFVAVDGFGWSKSTGDVADTFLRRALGWHSFLHGEMSRHGITADVVRANVLDGSG